MVKRKPLDRGDIVRVNLAPTVGREQQGVRPGLVLSKAEFNVLGVSIVAPISQGGEFARVAGFAVSLMGCGTETQGVVLVNASRTLDLDARNAVRLESAPEAVVDEALARLRAVLE